MRHHIVLRYVAVMVGIAAAHVFLMYLNVVQPYGGLLAMAVVATVAWLGGFGPSLLIVPVMFTIARLARPGGGALDPVSTREFTVLIVVAGLAISAGLAGEYRRRFGKVTAEHAQKHQEQARALSLAHIVFRDINGRITDWNEGAERLYGWSAGQALGHNLHTLLQTQFARPFSRIQDEFLQNGQWEGEVIHRRIDGAELNIAVHWILYRNKRGAPIGVAEVHNDVTELRRVEEALREADRRKVEFLALLAHELRNPLAPIRTGLELMKLTRGDPATIEETRSIMERQTLQLVSLVDDLLDISRITSGKLELRRRPVQVCEVVRSAVEASTPNIHEANHRLTVDVRSPEIYLDADPHRLAQVISNLLNNAVKFTPEGGDIALLVEQQGMYVAFSVNDQGIGIPEEMLGRIFDMFAQIEHPQGSEYGGLGIGLSLVKSLVEMHGGVVEARSHGMGTGSTFCVRLPIALDQPLKETQDSPADENAPDRRGCRVLVVDDNKAAADILAKFLEKLGHEVQTAEDGHQAVERAADFLPKVVVMDIGMPNMNGYEAARFMRLQDWGKEMVLIALTGWGQEEDRQRTLEAGFDHHLVKPVEPLVLQNILADLTREQQS